MYTVHHVLLTVGISIHYPVEHIYYYIHNKREYTILDRGYTILDRVVYNFGQGGVELLLYTMEVYIYLISTTRHGGLTSLAHYT